MIVGKIVVAGSREITSGLFVFDELDKLQSEFQFTELVSGAARGIDTIGESWALLHYIPIKQFPANWKTFGLSAGHKRNKQMADYCDAVICFWDGVSRGTKSMIDFAKASGKPLTVLIVKKDSLGFRLVERQNFNFPV